MNADPIYIVDRVNAYYASAFSQLVIFTVAILAFAGVIVPLVIQYYQNRALSRDKKATEDFVLNEITKRFESLTSKMQQDFAERDAQQARQLAVKLNEIAAEQDKKLARLNGRLFHVQGVDAIGHNQHLPALASFCISVENYIVAEDELNLVTVLENTEILLPLMYKNPLAHDAPEVLILKEC